MHKKRVPMSGWKVRTGTIIAIVGMAFLSSSDVFTNTQISHWIEFIGKVCVGIGGGLASWGIGHKVEKVKTSIESVLVSLEKL